MGERSIAAFLRALQLLGNVFPLIEILRYWGALPRLSSFEAALPESAPRLSIVVPARDEEERVEEAVSSMIRQDYPEIEVVLVDDRSTDRTGEIMARLAAEHSDRVRMLTVRSLPPGWLGKNHALWLGARAASGEWLLLTDADILFDPACCRRALALALDERCDHLTLAPEVVAHGYWLEAFVAFFAYIFVTSQRAYLANDPASSVGIGLGAFNLIRRSAYEAVGTHAAFSLRPDEDVQLGRRVKRAGLRQRVLDGSDLLAVEWYPSLGAAMRGLEKNMFAALNYSVPQTIAGVAWIWLVLVDPALSVWRASGWGRRLLLGAIGAQAASFLAIHRYRPRQALRVLPAFPVAAAMFAYAALRSSYLALRRGGIWWRDTFYPLDQLREQPGVGQGPLAG